MKYVLTLHRGTLLCFLTLQLYYSWSLYFL